MIFYLQQLENENVYVRAFIDDHLHEGATELDRVEADNWKEARDLIVARLDASDYLAAHE